MRSLRSPLPALALTAATALLLTACGSTEAPADAEETSASSGAGPVTVTDDRGEVELDAPAEKVVSLEWGLTENLLSLGVTPVGAADVEGYNTWDQIVPLEGDVTDVGTRGEPSLDAIAGLGADLVVTTTDLPENVIAQIEETVPVIALRGSDASDPIGHMRRTIEVLGEATGRSDEAADVLAEYDAAVEEGKAALAEAGLEGSSFTMADGWVADGTVSVRMFTEGAFLGALGQEIGLVNAWEGEGDPDYGLAVTDVEGLTQLTDAPFLYLASSSEADPFGEALATNPIWTGLPFVAAGDVHRLPDGIWQFGGPAAAQAWIEATVEALTAA